MVGNDAIVRELFNGPGWTEGKEQLGTIHF